MTRLIPAVCAAFGAILVAIGIWLAFNESAQRERAETEAAAPVDSIPSAKVRNTQQCKVIDIIDGDTLRVELAGNEVRVRLIGVDTPELHPKAGEGPQRYAKEAAAFLGNLLRGEKVWLEEESDQLDFYGRKLAYVYRCPDGLFVNQELVRQGYARFYSRYPFQRYSLFRDVERSAQSSGRGLWGSGPSTVKGTEIPAGSEKK